MARGLHLLCVFALLAPLLALRAEPAAADPGGRDFFDIIEGAGDVLGSRRGRGNQGNGRGNGRGNQGGQATCGDREISEALARTGGQFLSFSQSNRGGQTVCEITIIVPPQGGERRPRRTTITIRP